MPKRTRSYRSWQMEQLADSKKAANYLNASLEEGNEQFLIAVGKVAQANGLAEVAKDSNVRRETMYRAFAPQGNPTFTNLTAVLSRVGMKLLVARTDNESGNGSGEIANSSHIPAKNSNTSQRIDLTGKLLEACVAEHVKLVADLADRGGLAKSQAAIPPSVFDLTSMNNKEFYGHN